MRAARVVVLILSLILPLRADCASDRAARLVELAKQRFGELTPGETKMLEAAATGDMAACAKEGENGDPANAASWNTDRIIHAERVAWLCTDPEASACVSYHGVRVRGARVDGELDLAHAEVKFPLLLLDCALTDELNLWGAHLNALYLNGADVKSIVADGVKVDGNVYLRKANVHGEMRLLDATIGGDLDCDGGVFNNAAGDALSADGIQVDAGVFLRNGNVHGGVRLPGATIGGDLDCSDGVFNKPDGYALSADGVHVGRKVSLSGRFRADGEVRLPGATIGGNLVCENGMFNNPGGNALSADNLHVEGSAFLREGFQANGRVSLVGASVRSHFVWQKVASPQSARLDLRSAQIGTFVDDEASWPDSGQLLLQGLAYDKLDSLSQPAVSVANRLRWLGLQPRSDSFRPQPYEQLAKVLRESGDEEGAKEILIAKNQERAMHTSGPRYVLYWLYGKATEYVYHPWWPLGWLGVLFILGWVLFRKGLGAGVMVCIKEGPGGYRPDLWPPVYSIETLIPLVNLHHAEYWMPHAGKRSRNRPWRHGPSFGTVLRIYLWFHVSMGWIFSTLLAIGLAGLMRA